MISSGSGDARSPGLAEWIDGWRWSGTSPTPDVVIKTPSPCRGRPPWCRRSRGDVGLFAGDAHRSHDAARRSSIGRPSSRMNAAEGTRESRRPRQVVHRAVNGQLADITTGKEKRPNDKPIGRHRDARQPEYRLWVAIADQDRAWPGLQAAHPACRVLQAGRNTFWISSAVSLPPLPLPKEHLRMVRQSATGNSDCRTRTC